MKYSREFPTWNDYVAHPDYDAFWKAQAAVPYLNHTVTVPTLNVAGWWDQEDFYGPVTIYREMEKHDPNNLNFLVVGPWNHGGWGGVGKTLGAIDFGVEHRGVVSRRSAAPLLRCNLKGAATGCKPAEATLFRSGDNKWVTSATFPRTGGRHADGALSRRRMDASFSASEPPARDLRIRSSLIPPTRCRIASDRSSRPTDRGHSGARGSWKTSASWSIAPTC